MRREDSTDKAAAIAIATRLLMAAILLPCLMACGSRAFDRTVITADSLAEANPHEALRFIDSIRAAGGNKPGRSKMMKLAMLKTKACNKLRLP